HEVVHTGDRGVEGVHGNHADWHAFFLVPFRRDVPAPMLDDDLHVQHGALVQGRNVEVRREDLDVRIVLHVAGFGDPGPFLTQAKGLRLLGMQLEADLLDVENDVGDVLGDAANRGEFVQDALDSDGYDRGAGQR